MGTSPPNREAGCFPLRGRPAPRLAARLVNEPFTVRCLRGPRLLTEFFQEDRQELRKHGHFPATRSPFPTARTWTHPSAVPGRRGEQRCLLGSAEPCTTLGGTSQCQLGSSQFNVEAGLGDSRGPRATPDELGGGVHGRPRTLRDRKEPPRVVRTEPPSGRGRGKSRAPPAA